MPEALEIDLAERENDLRALYTAVFAEPPWNEDAAAADEFIARLTDERAQGARGVGLFERSRLLGLAYAVPTPIPFPSGRAYDRVAHVCDPAHLQGTWEVMEVAVHPGARGRGHADDLLSALLDRCAPAWLLTSTDAAAALRFYDRRDDLTRFGEGEGLVVYTTT